MLVEGSSRRSISRVADVSINTVTKLLVDAGETAIDLHHRLVRDVKTSKVQCDEIWSFNYCKQRSVATAKTAPLDAGDVWTCAALDAETKLIVTYAAGDRTLSCARLFMEDLKQRLANRVQITSDGHRAYVEAVDEAFGDDVDFVQLQKLYGPTPSPPGRYSPAQCTAAKTKIRTGNPDPKHIGTSHVERSNPTIRMQNQRFTRLTNAFSRKIDNHLYALALFFLHCNFVRVHKSFKVTPTMADGITDSLWSVEDIAEQIEARRPTPAKRDPYKKRATNEVG